MRSAKRGSGLHGGRRRSPTRVLVGDCYRERATGLTVRVVDATTPRRLGGGRFVVEAADGRRAGERWLCRAAELKPLPAAGAEEHAVRSGASPSTTEVRP